MNSMNIKKIYLFFRSKIFFVAHKKCTAKFCVHNIHNNHNKYDGGY